MRANGRNTSSEKIRCISSNRFNACINFCSIRNFVTSIVRREKNIIFNLAGIDGAYMGMRYVQN